MLCGVRYFGEEVKTSLTRAVVAHAVTFLTDLVFWLLFGISSVLLIYNVSGGVFRFSIYPLMLFGLVIYYVSIGKLLLKLSSRVVLLLGRLCRAVIRLISLPLSLLKRFFIFITFLL